ncbi:MAG: helicase-related protein [Anaerolineae bacterium]
MTTDLTFFTNQPDAALLDRFKATLRDVQFFDVLVGYFRTSGFYLLADALEGIEEIRILVGLGVDRQTVEIVEASGQQLELAFQSTRQTKDLFADELVDEMDRSADTADTERGVRTFMQWLHSGKLKLKAHPSRQIHAKVYISRFHSHDRDFGRVITGSSNFSYSGLLGNYEFNVELKDAPDVRFALDRFEALWAEAVDISDAYVDAIQQRTWLNDQIPPYELYLKFLYEYFKEDINADQEIDVWLPEGFLDLAYQKQAVTAARKILEAYGGVFLADVVGLGKTFIAALLAQQLPGRKLVICPPVLKEYWQDTLREFGVPARVESMGKLDHILAGDYQRYDIVFVDEAHRFRNEDTQGYEKLHRICWGRKVVLVSATPLNNTIGDVFTQLKLFQAPRRSAIPGVSDLESFFTSRTRWLESFEKGSPEHLAAVKQVAGQVRERVLKHVMVRRTRSEIERFFQEDLSQQGLAFPELADPQRIVYRFDAATEAAFDATIRRLRGFSYARYTPLLYLQAGVSQLEEQSQRNVGAFMKGLLVKRLESSFFAFQRTLARFIQSYQRFIAMLAGGAVYISKAVDIYALLEQENEEELLRLVETGEVRQYPAAAFRPELEDDLRRDLALLQEIEGLWQGIQRDPKLEQFVRELRHDPVLKGQRIIVFTESSETGSYLYEQLETAFPGKVLFYWSQGATYDGAAMSGPAARDLIRQNYDPQATPQRNNLNILVTTDTLAEGVNLHRANVVVNYDLPWNPTRVLQRVGRVNRVGTAFDQVFIYNFFPTAQSDEHLGLEGNIKAKIQAFHDILGEDARYLTEEEVISQHELFGDRLYQALSRKESYLGEEEARSELEYLQAIRQVRDQAPQTFERIKRLPKKARSGRAVFAPPVADDSTAGDYLVSFFRRGRLKKFYTCAGDQPVELTFLDAAERLRCTPETPRLAIPAGYFDLLARNKAVFAEATEPEAEATPRAGGGQSNVRWVVSYLKAIRRAPTLTDDDERHLQAVLDAFEAGVVPSPLSQRLKRALEREANPLRAVAILRSTMPASLVDGTQGAPADAQPVEVILSEYQEVQLLP